MDDRLGALHLVVLAAVFAGASGTDEIAARLGVDADDVVILLADLEREGVVVIDH